MRIGVIAGIVILALGLGLLYGAWTGAPLIDSDVEESMETLQSATEVTEEGDWGNYISLLAAPFEYMGSIVSMAWKGFTSPIWNSGGWALVPYFTISPFIVVLIFGMILLFIGVLQKQV